MRRLFCAALVIGLTGTAAAEEQFWVSVGSYRNAANAEEARHRTNEKLHEIVTISVIDIDAERWHRVVVGPYLTRGIAELTLVEAEQAGFNGTWILVVDSLDFAGEGYEGATYGDYEDEYGALPDYDRSDAHASDSYRDIDSLLPTLSNSEEEKATRVPREVVGSAPEGYGLHKLRRSGD